MTWLLLGSVLLVSAGCLWYRNSRPETSWYGLPPETAEAIWALPLVVAAIGIAVGVIGLLQVFG